MEQELASIWAVVEKGGFAAFAVILLWILYRLGTRFLDSVEKLHDRIGDVQEKIVGEQQKLASDCHEIRRDLPGICKFDPSIHCANFSGKGS